MNFFGKSDTGKVRSANQDSYLIRAITRNATLAVVCDGMGGAKSGNVASECAVEVFCERVVKYASGKIHDGHLRLTSDDACIILDNAVHDANTAVWRKSQSSPDFQGMGTTLVAALFVDDVVYVVNVGDSRLYLISDNTITQITHDHSYVQHLIDNGSLTAEDARTHPYRNRITRAVGIKGDLETDIFSVDLASLDVCYLLLCSDGLCGQLVPEDIYSIISSDLDIDVVTDVESELQDKTERLISAANEAGGPDNITAVLVKYVGDGEKRVEDDDDDE
ncbi:MAG: Stp1/IreP family PP2C-type Ser/Thr phosphatase [Clostridia bacterium]|nr:Stp1/IreP family PP2C-type Ser/Thr phosphatase [Clostridia bacterium]MBQ2706720.1 Stp1/IreP family PP2C-type Ser/Thr phosphatase [Clostridia bacterium]